MNVNDLLLVDLVEIPRGSVCISRVLFEHISCFASNFLSRAFRNLKKTQLKKTVYEELVDFSFNCF